MDKNCDTYVLDVSITTDKEDTNTMSSLSGLDYWSNDMTTSATLGSTGSTGSTLRTTLGTVGSIGASNVTWTTPGTITSGGYLTTGASGSLTGATYANVTTSWNGWNTTQAPLLKVTGNAEFEGEVTIRGVKLDERLDAIEERLGILRPNNDLEGKWEKLKALGDEYRALEKDILEKEKIWDLLKK